MKKLPLGTRLILAQDDILAQWGARTLDGYRITAEWGEQKPEGWYEPTFTVHYDEPLVDVEQLVRKLEQRLRFHPEPIQ